MSLSSFPAENSRLLLPWLDEAQISIPPGIRILAHELAHRPRQALGVAEAMAEHRLAEDAPLSQLVSMATDQTPTAHELCLDRHLARL
jgi:hypothetical protein